jgi:hypothetical protein
MAITFACLGEEEKKNKRTFQGHHQKREIFINKVNTLIKVT